MNPKHKHERTEWAKHLERIKQDVIRMRKHVDWLLDDIEHGKYYQHNDSNSTH